MIQGIGILLVMGALFFHGTVMEDGRKQGLNTLRHIFMAIQFVVITIAALLLIYLDIQWTYIPAGLLIFVLAFIHRRIINDRAS